MYCGKCGAKLEDHEKKCHECGAPVRIRRPVEPAPANEVKDPVYFEKPGEDVDVESIVRIAHGEEPASFEEKKDRPGRKAGGRRISREEYLASLSPVEKVYRYLQSISHDREEQEDKRRMREHLDRAAKYYADAGEPETPVLRQAANPSAGPGPVKDVKKKADSAQAEKKARAQEQEKARQAREEEKARALEEEKARQAREEEKARALEEEKARQAREEEMIRAQEQEKARALEEKKARQAREEEKTRALEQEKAHQARGEETAPVAAPAPERETRVPVRTETREVREDQPRRILSREEEEIRQARRIRRYYEDQEDGLDRFLGKFGISRETAVRIATLFLIAVLSVIYVMGRGDAKDRAGSAAPGSGMTGAESAPEAGGDNTDAYGTDSELPTGGGDFQNSSDSE
ncbi:MAG: hypothetical protein E7238_01035 [Sarcina sp.]|nr:hypothetical protein [Sarcina sp.]